MNKKKQYVIHISGQGKKWEVVIERADYWICRDVIVLPKSEYAPCDPPEEWEDITDRCEVSPNGFLICDGKPLEYTNSRFTKIDYIYNGPAFIIERRKS